MPPPELRHRTERRVTAGRFHPLGPTAARGRRELRSLQPRSDRRLPPALRRRGRAADRRDPPAAARRATSSTGWSTAFAPGSSTRTRSGAPSSPRMGCGSTSTSRCSTPTPRRSPASRRARTTCCSAYDPVLAVARPLARHARLDRRDAASVSWSTTRSTGRATCRPDAAASRSSLIYEVHVKGFTAHASSGVRQAGHLPRASSRRSRTWSSSASTRSSSCPSTSIYVEDFLTERGLTNYWGYNTLGFFAPESSYAGGHARPGARWTR